jgi:hypothetical protein
MEWGSEPGMPRNRDMGYTIWRCGHRGSVGRSEWSHIRAKAPKLSFNFLSSRASRSRVSLAKVESPIQPGPSKWSTYCQTALLYGITVTTNILPP